MIIIEVIVSQKPFSTILLSFTSLNLQKMKFVVSNINLDFICYDAHFLSEVVFFCNTYVNLPVLWMKNGEFSFLMVILFS